MVQVEPVVHDFSEVEDRDDDQAQKRDDQRELDRRLAALTPEPPAPAGALSALE
jgi:hypothetical protein